MCRRSVVSAYLLTLALLLAAAACSHKSTPSQESKAAPEKTATSEVPTDALIASMNSFGFKLFAEIVNSEFDKNILISPVSISMALQMTYNGAAGETKEAMAKVLELERLSLRGVNEASAKLLEALANPEQGVEFIIANSLWARKDIPFRKEFLRRGEEYYKAYIRTLDFRKPKAADVINKWVSDSTKGKIKKLIQKIKRDDVLFLINAAYFKGEWRFKFDKTETFLRDFHLLDGRTKEVPMMTGECNSYRYLRTDKFQAVSMPYGEGRFSMYVFLPDEKSSLKEFYAVLDKGNWDMWMSRLEDKEGIISLPRFEFRYEILLNDALKALGMGIAFDRR
ncbi:MAG TPA: serpin family protein, partial [Proteobacteria bacterium]|nr:serpin family protein [Pseudomonadota bacterium]